MGLIVRQIPHAFFKKCDIIGMISTDPVRQTQLRFFATAEGFANLDWVLPSVFVLWGENGKGT